MAEGLPVSFVRISSKVLLADLSASDRVDNAPALHMTANRSQAGRYHPQTHAQGHASMVQRHGL